MRRVSLLLLDLDNTLIDRDAAFRQAVTEFLLEYDLPTADVGWVMEADAGGYQPRAALAQALQDRYTGLGPDAVQAFIDRGAADHVTLTEPARAALRRATAAGWTCVIVTNGSVRQQERKIAISGLDAEVAGWVVSEGVGYRKPQPEIFAAAADAVGARLDDGGWMVGDAPRHDIAGAVEVGLRSVWLHLGRSWPADLAFRPTQVADDVTAALDHVVRSNADRSVELTSD